MKKQAIIRVALTCVMACAAARAASLQLLPQGALTGSNGSTVGWGFTITNAAAGQWIEITSANFCTGTSGTTTACGAPAIGTFTDFISGYNDVIVGASPNNTTVTQSYTAASHAGTGSFQITASSGTATGQIVLTYNVFSRSPLDPAFDPDTDTVSTDNFLTASASVTVVAPPPGTPAPPSLVLALTSLLLLGGWQMRRRFAARRKTTPRCLTLALLTGLPLLIAPRAQAQPNWEAKVITPSQRQNFAMAYDPVRGQTVLFGGLLATQPGDTFLSYGQDTWVFDGWKWTQKFPVHKPTQRYYTAMAFDPVQQVMILYGGTIYVPGENGFTGNDTWAWNGNDWTELSPAHNPGTTTLGNLSIAMATDTARSRIVLIDSAANTWEWDGSDWNQKHPITSPPSRAETALAYDAQHGYTILFGGRSGSTNYADTWLWDGNNWTLAGMFNGPPKRAYHHMTYDAERRQVLLFGGFDINVAFYNDLWAWDGLKWNQLGASCDPCSSIQPFEREAGGMVYDPMRKASILFGGYRWPGSFNTSTSNYLDDTWSWDGSAWTTLAAPLHRLNQSMVWDSAHNQAVMFGGWVEDGGYDGTIYETNETWVWNGAVWTLKNPAHQPPARQLAAMAYDAARQQTIMFGGLQTVYNSSNVTLHDMWAWDGNDWTQLTPTTLPSARYGSLTAYDAANQRVVLFGGYDTAGRNDTWVWNGTNWTQLSPTNPPSAEWAGVGMAYDPVRQRVMLVQYGYSGYIDATNNWTTLPAPPASLVGPMVWDTALGKMFFMNRWSGCCSTAYNMWTWDGTTWAQLSTTTMPPKRNDEAMVYDPVRNQVVMYGGNLMDIISANYPTNDTWALTTPEITGDIYVQTNQSQAFYTVSGPASYSGSGTASSWSGVGPGIYTNMYGSVSGYITPNSVTQTLAAGGTIGFVSGYAALPGSIQVASNVTAGFTITGTYQYSGAATPVTLSNVPAATYTIHWTPVAGYTTPTPQTQTLTNGGSISFTGSYTALQTTCTLTVTTNLAASTFSVVGPSSYYGGGTSYSQQGISPGTYTITFDAVFGYLTPPPQTQAVTTGGTLAFTGTYQAGSPPVSVGWVLKSPAPWGRTSATAVYDGARQQVLMFGGIRGNAINETWVYDGTTWSNRTPAHSPAAQTGPPMAYDSVNQRVVLSGTGTTTRETWTWNGTDWTKLSPVASPTAYGDSPAIAYDSVHHQTVLVNDYCSQTWVWDGTNWTQKSPATSLPGNGYCIATYDAARSQVVLITYYYVYTPSLSLEYDTWTWDGTNWTKKEAVTTANYYTPPTTVPALAPMVYDPATQLVVLFDPSGNTWTWNGAAWSQQSPATSPPARSGPQLVFDPVSSRVWMIGGLGGNVQLSNDVWVWDGTNWTEKAATPNYPVRISNSFAYDPARAEVVQFGGQSGSFAVMNDTWIWDGTTWTQRDTATVPHPRFDFPMVFDQARKQMVMFGGDATYLYLNDTWVWDGGNWTQKSPTNVPPNRRGNMMAYDAAHSVVVLFGGTGFSGPLNDTWTWDGTNWTQMNPATSPPGRDLGSMSYDPVRGKVVLFGGQILNPASKLGDTWEWDGTNWTQRSPATSPAARCAAGMAYDILRGYTLLYGGNTSGTGYTFGQDTWTWDGTNWTQQNSLNTPPATIVGMTYDAARGQVMTFGGWTANGHQFAEDVWVWDKIIGAISVSTNLAGATFSLTGPASYSGSGTAWSQSNATPGDYTITYGAVAGYTTPPSQILTLAPDGTVAFTGTYTQAVQRFAVSVPSAVTQGTAFNFTVTAEDANNNTVTGYAGTVHFTSTDTSAVLPANATLTSGTGTFSATLKTNGNQTITATDAATSSIAGTSNPIAVSTAPTWTITSTHTGNWTQGQQGVAYTLTLSNPSAAASSGAVTVTDTIPTAFSLVSMAGTGWTCSGNSCSRSDALAAGGSWPVITVTVNVGINASSPQMNQASVAGGGLSGNSVNDSTTVNPMAGGAAVLFGVIAGKSGPQNARQWTFEVGNSGTGAAAGAQIGGIQFTQTSMGGGSACTPSVTSPTFPLAVGNIPAGASAQGTVTINFTGCANAAEFSVFVQLAANGGAITGSILRHDEER